MAFPKEHLSSANGNDSPVNTYAYQAMEALLLLHESFIIRVEKLKSALKKGTINNREYDAWLSCFQDIKSGWLMHEISTTDDILLLQLLAQHNMQDALLFAVPE
jgi:hypothetical protein